MALQASVRLESDQQQLSARPGRVQAEQASWRATRGCCQPLTLGWLEDEEAGGGDLHRLKPTAQHELQQQREQRQCGTSSGNCEVHQGEIYDTAVCWAEVRMGQKSLQVKCWLAREGGTACLSR